MLCHYWYFKDRRFQFEQHVCNKCHVVLMTAYELKNIAILSVKADNFRCILWGISRDELKDIDQKSYCSDYYDVSVNKYGIKYRIPLRFWENKGWINNIDPYGWFQWYFRRLEDRTTMKDKFK